MNRWTNMWTTKRLDNRRRAAIAYLRNNPHKLTQITGALWRGNGFYCAVGALAKNLGVKDEYIKAEGYETVERKLQIKSYLIYNKNDTFNMTFGEIADYLEDLWFPKED